MPSAFGIVTGLFFSVPTKGFRISLCAAAARRTRTDIDIFRGGRERREWHAEWWRWCQRAEVLFILQILQVISQTLIGTRYTRAVPQAYENGKPNLVNRNILIDCLLRILLKSLIKGGIYSTFNPQVYTVNTNAQSVMLSCVSSPNLAPTISGNQRSTWLSCALFSIQLIMTARFTFPPSPFVFTCLSLCLLLLHDSLTAAAQNLSPTPLEAISHVT